MTSSTNDCKWKRYKNKQIGEYFTCYTNDNIYRTIHLAKYPKKGCTFDKEKIKQYKDVLGKKEDMKDAQNLTKNLKKLHIQLYDGKKEGVVVKKGFKIISKGKNGWKPMVPINSLITSRQQRGGKVVVPWKSPFHYQPPQKVPDDLKIKCKAAPAIQSCTIDQKKDFLVSYQVDDKTIYTGINLLENPSCDSHSCEIEKYFSIGKFPEGFESFDSYLEEPSSSDNVQQNGGTTTPYSPINTTNKPFLFFSNTKAFINHTLWNDANDGDDKTRIVPHLENGKRKHGEDFVGNKAEMIKFNEVLKKLAPYQHNHLNILNIVTAPLQYILPPNEPSALTEGPRPWEKRIEVISRISESVVMLKQLFRRTDRSVVNIFNIHLYDPEVEMYNYMKIEHDEKKNLQEAMSVIDPSTIFANESSLMKYFTKSVVDQIKAENEVVRKDGRVPTQKFKSFEKMLLLCKEGQIVGTENKSLEKFINEMGINMIYCAGGETHWLNRQMKENKLFETLNKPEFNRIVWSGFSAGIINAGNTTAMAAEKVFNRQINPGRLIRGVGAVDDITVIKSKTPTRKFCKVYKTENNQIKLEYEQTPDDCDMTGANWFRNGVVFPHYNPLWMEMIIDVMSKGKKNPHFKDVDKLLIMADGECVHNLNSTESDDIVDRLPDNMDKIKHEMTKEKIIFARKITDSLITFVNTMSISSTQS